DAVDAALEAPFWLENYSGMSLFVREQFQDAALLSDNGGAQSKRTLRMTQQETRNMQRATEQSRDFSELFQNKNVGIRCGPPGSSAGLGGGLQFAENLIYGASGAV
ncbi:unnamed protein product, partial [Amoebophrya sp. A25]